MTVKWEEASVLDHARNSPDLMIKEAIHIQTTPMDRLINRDKGAESLFELSGESMFSNNSAERGAGLALYNSTVQFGSGSLTVFVNNTACEFGGAIYISSLPMLLPAVLISLENKRDTASQQALAAAITRQQCFYSIDLSGTFQIYFAGNSAILGGMDVFGSAVTLNNCGLAYSSYVQVTSDPTRVCFCADRIPQYTG